MLQLGQKPEPLRLLVTRGTNFAAEIELLDADDDWAGQAPELHFDGATPWVAVLEGAKLASFYVTAAVVDETLSVLAGRDEVSLKYGDAVLAKGRLEVL